MRQLQPATAGGTVGIGGEKGEGHGRAGDIGQMFRRAKLGPLVGKRTWGGLVGIGGYPNLLDGGTVTAPHFAFWNPEGEWDVENHGVAPDYEVEHDPAAVRRPCPEVPFLPSRQGRLHVRDLAHRETPCIVAPAE